MIPFNKPFVAGSELCYMEEALRQRHISGDGPFTRKCHAVLEACLGAPKALLTTSGTHAIELAALLLDLQPADEVIVPAFTFVSTPNAFVLRGARPIFVDIRADTLNMDETQLARHISARTKAIVPVHYAGVACEMDAIIDLAGKHGVAVVEDNAHGLFGRYKDRPLGAIGALAALSFHETKNFSCGEGGALIINDKRFIERAEILREKGTDRARFFRGQVDKYTWVDVGSSYLPSDLLAAFLFAQLEAREEIQLRRRRIWEYYHSQLESWARERNVRQPIAPQHCAQSYHMYYLILPSLAERQALIAHLKARGVNSVFHYQPLHLSAMGRRFGGKPGDCPVTEQVSDRLVRLPFFNDLTLSEQKQIVSALREFPV